MLKVETKICAIWGILEANLKKRQHTKIHDEYQFCTFKLKSQIHHLNFHRKKVCLFIFFPWKIYFPAIFDFHFRENPRFRDECQALVVSMGEVCCQHAAGGRGSGKVTHVIPSFLFALTFVQVQVQWTAVKVSMNHLVLDPLPVSCYSLSHHRNWETVCISACHIPSTKYFFKVTPRVHSDKHLSSTEISIFTPNDNSITHMSTQTNIWQQMRYVGSMYADMLHLILSKLCPVQVAGLRC